MYIFGKANQTSILNLLPNLQDPTSNPGWIITHTDIHTFLHYSDNVCTAHYTFTAISCGIKQTTLTIVTQIYIHSVQPTITVETSLLIILLPSCITCTKPILQLLSSTMPGKDLSMPPVKILAMS